MTREEREKEIVKAAEKMLDGNPNYMSTRELAFVLGAHWADEHPYWISVEDELPPCNVFVLTCDKQENTNLLMLAGDGRWYDKAVGLHRNITHWMPLPQAPKKGGEE